MTDSRGGVALGGLLRTLRLAGLDIDAEAALDSVWLALRMQEQVASAAASGNSVDAQPGPSPRLDDAAGDGVRREPTETSPQRDPLTSRGGQPPVGGGVNTGAPAAPARTVTLARAAALPESRTLIRALRPLRRRVASPGAGVLDLDTTVRRAAEEDLWIPSFASARERWLDVLLVADHGLSMIVWKDTIDEFERALRNAGAFRSVRSWWLESDTPEPGIAPRGRAPRPATPQALTKLVRGMARSIVLVISDCVSPRWHDGAIPRLMAGWSQQLPVALVQVTPEWFWARTALGDTVPSSFRSPIPATVNRRLRWDTSALGTVAMTPEMDASFLRVPAMTLTAGAVSRVAGLMAGVSREWSPGVVFDLTWEGDDESRQPSTAGAKERVDRFRALASSQAQRLVAAFSASPVRTLNVLRLLRRDLLPGASPFVEAEVLLGGVVRVRKEGAHWDLGEDLPLEFFPGAQPLLLDGVVAADVVRVLAHAARVAATGVGPTFTAWLDSPESGAAQLDPSDSAFAASAAEVLSRLGGSYARIVKPAPVVEAPESAGINQSSETPESQAPQPTAPPVESEEQVIGKPHQLPITSPLVGRDALVDRILQPPDGQPDQRPIWLIGDQGIGKTAIAAHLMQTWTARADGEEPFVWRFQLNPSTRDALNALTDRYAEARSRDSGRGGAVIYAFAQRTQGLVVFDGVDDSNSAEGLLELIRMAMSTSTPSPRVLLTARQRPEGAGEPQVMEVGPLRREDFEVMFVSKGQEGASTLFELSAGNPLVARALAENSTQLSELDLLEELGQTPGKRQVVGPSQLVETVDLIDRAIRARKFSTDAFVRREDGDIDGALRSLTEVVRLRGRLPSLRLRAEALFDRGQLNLRSKKDYERASADLADAVGLFGMVSAPRELGQAQQLLAEARVATGRLDEAFTLLENALKNAMSIKDDPFARSVLFALAKVEVQRGRLDEAVAFVREGLTVAGRIGGYRDSGMAHLEAARILSQAKHLQEALTEANLAANLLLEGGGGAELDAAYEEIARIKQASDLTDPERVQTVEYHVRGRVQGVGFRFFVQNAARDIAVQAEATNLRDGRVHVRATGPRSRLDQLETMLRKGPPQSKVEGIDMNVLAGDESTAQGKPPSPTSEGSGAPAPLRANRRLNGSRAVIAIGVGALRSLPRLSGTVEAARSVAAWAQSQGIPAITVLTDDSATTSAIQDALRAVIDRGTISQLILYFAGYSCTVRHDRIWLLRGAPEDPSAAVSVNECTELARHSGIPHVVLVSDACQVSATALSAMHMTGGGLLPDVSYNGPSGTVDQFHATTVGSSAFEPTDVASEATRYAATYTTSLLVALSGAQRTLLEERDGTHFLRPREVAEYLDKAVARLAAAHGVTPQKPEKRIESDSDAWLAAFDGPEPHRS